MRSPLLLGLAALVLATSCGDSVGEQVDAADRSTPSTRSVVEHTSTSDDPVSTTSTPEAPDQRAGDERSVNRVVDGDTIEVDGAERVRLIGIDTPETKDPRADVQCFGREASAFTTSLLPAGTPVRLVYDIERLDRYGRTLAYVYRLSDGLFVNLELALQGYAEVATYPPNVLHESEFRAATREAREEGRGLWSACRDDGTDETTPAVGCDPSYPDVCIPPPPPDLDCGDIPQRRFRVVGSDPHGFDRDGDGVGCES